MNGATVETNVYAAFSQHLSLAQAKKLSVLDDGEGDGLLSRWVQVCADRYEALSEGMSEGDEELWALERNTWSLVQALYAQRLAPDRPDTSSQISNAYATPHTVAQSIIAADRDLTELNAIKEWLSSIPMPINPAEVRKGYLPYTKNKLSQAKRTGAKVPRGMVDQLDPDSVLRDGEAGSAAGRLDGEDIAYERALVRSLYEYVRVGDAEAALDMCRQSDQSWRAASLSGGLLWSDPELGAVEDGDDMDMDAVDGSEKRAKGNLNRRMWKLTCRKLAAAPGLDPYERALYGALSGDIASVLPVCSTWEDHVWTHVSALLESKLEAGLWLSSNGRFWNRGAIKSVEQHGTALDSEDTLLGTSGRGGSMKDELEGIFDGLMKLDKGDLAASARNPFHLSQTYLIVGKIEQLFTTFVERLEQLAAETEEETIAHLLRFLAHLVLVLRELNQPLPEAAANRILEAYVSVLEANNQDENLIAFYASKLDASSAVESYARFLLTFGAEADIASREAALLKAHEHGLNLAQIACRTVELVLAGIRDEGLGRGGSTAFDAHAQVDARQIELIRSLEWLTFDPSTYREALIQANALTRYFLTTEKPQAVRELLTQIPSDVITQSAGLEAIERSTFVREYLDYTSFFNCLQKHTEWTEIWARRSSQGSSKLDQMTYRAKVGRLVDDFHQAAIDLLESDWLKLNDTADDLDSRRRRSELTQVRQLLIPELILRLHHTLYDTRTLIPSNLQRALNLANVVADERYQLYLDFVTQEKGNRISDYIVLVGQASQAALAGGDPFVVLPL